MSDIHSKIADLFELANNNPNEAEAASAAAMARKLMLKHNIDERDIGRKANVGFNGEKSVDRDYYLLLTTGISELIPAKALIYTNGRNKTIKWAATAVNAQVANQMLEFWARQIEALYKQALPAGMSKSQRAQYRKDFKRNAAVTIIHRARELRKQQNLEKGTGTSLLVIQTELEAEVDEFLSTVRTRKTRGMTVRSSGLGASHGRQAGQSVRLNRGVTG